LIERRPIRRPLIKQTFHVGSVLSTSSGEPRRGSPEPPRRLPDQPVPVPKQLGQIGTTTLAPGPIFARAFKANDRTSASSHSSFDRCRSAPMARTPAGDLPKASAPQSRICQQGFPAKRSPRRRPPALHRAYWESPRTSPAAESRRKPAKRPLAPMRQRLVRPRVPGYRVIINLPQQESSAPKKPKKIWHFRSVANWNSPSSGGPRGISTPAGDPLD